MEQKTKDVASSLEEDIKHTKIRLADLILQMRDVITRIDWLDAEREQAKKAKEKDKGDNSF